MEKMNSDKNIEIIKDFLGYNTYKYITLDYWEGTTMNPTKELNQAISNVLLELETWKKTAEKLSDLLHTSNANYICKNIPEEKCIAYLKNNVTCMQCTIDWARSEVSND